jgi:hypothetical protein
MVYMKAVTGGWDGIVGIMTCYGLESPEIKSQCG